MKVVNLFGLTLSVNSQNADPFQVEDGVFNSEISNRRYSDLHQMTLFYNPDFDHRKIWHYGCHCLMLSDRGLSTRGKGKPVDELDTICKTYKECVHCAKKEFGPECIPEKVQYGWQVKNNKIRSKQNQIGTCQRAIFECDHMYATKLAESDALQTWNQDFHGYFSKIGFDYRSDDWCQKRGGQAAPKCCGGYDKPYFLYNTLNPDLHCCADGTVQKHGCKPVA